MAEIIRQLIQPRERNLGDLTVRRVLPAFVQQGVGPFIFFDHMGPADFSAGEGMNVRPHPHIGLATVTYLFEGAILHRDNTGAVETIHPGDVNWMTAGKGIVHSERTPGPLQHKNWRLHGIQTWLALPKHAEETEPAFFHYPAHRLPVLDEPGLFARIIAGHFNGLTSPVPVFSATLYVDVTLATGKSLYLPQEHEERAIYILDGTVSVEGENIPPCTLAVLDDKGMLTITALSHTRFLLLGGDRMDGHRHIWWNFVASDQDKIEAAKEKWEQQAYTPIPGETEFIPLPKK